MKLLLAAFGSILFGVGALAMSLWTGIHSWRLIHHGGRTTGSIVEMHRGDRESDNLSAAPRFRFRDAAGLEHTVLSNFYHYPPAHRVGDSVKVVYDRSDPENARIDSFAYLWFAPVFTAGFGALFLPIGLLLFYARIRRGA
jgi:hypothetical protein